MNIKVEEILRPFVNKIWYSIIMILLINLVVLTMSLKYEGMDCGFLRLSNSFIITIGALCQQCKNISFTIRYIQVKVCIDLVYSIGTNTQMEQISTRITFLSILILSFLLYNY